jgi:tRNA-splicing ligase RtcB
MFTIGTERLPIRVWAEPSDLAGFDEAIAQARNLANHPLARQFVCLMPDFHVGYGMPIGGVLATEGGVVPNAVGVDIGCGMIAARTAIEAASVSRDELQQLRLAVHQRVPVGMKHHDRPQRSDFIRTHRETIEGAVTIREQMDAADKQIGTLGSGNHFIEVQHDPETGLLWLMLHSGSRNVGKRTCDFYHALARRAMDENGIAVPHADLSYLPEGSPEHDSYLWSMQWCMEFAEANRQHMLAAVCDAFREVTGIDLEERIDLAFDTHHNFAASEEHFGRRLWVHRKGAVKAEGLVTIPGSMGTASYICEGRRPEQSFNTCSHGAGRVMGRNQANRSISHEEAIRAMEHVVFNVRSGDYDEMPMVYKDINRVVEAQADLVLPLHRLLPLAVVKG